MNETRGSRRRSTAVSRVAALLSTLLLMLPAIARSDVLADTKAALRRLTGQQPLTATMDLQRSRHSKGRFLNDDFDGTAAVVVELDANGMRTRYSRQLLEHAEDEEWARSLDPARAAGTSETLSEALPVSLENTLDAARPLLRLISRGTLAGQRMEAGSRAIILHLATTGKPEGGDRTSVTVNDDELTLWVDGQGLPQRATRVRKGTAGILFVHVDTVRTESWIYATRGDHLVAMRTDDRSSVSGVGQHGEARTLWTARNVEIPAESSTATR
jgi:hypothetical protein